MRATEVQLYRAAEQLTEATIYFMVVFSPWAFGSTEPWAIWFMNSASYLLGLLLLLKLAIRFGRGYQPARWFAANRSRQGDSGWAGVFDAKGLTWVLAVLTVLLLAFCLTSALNARASFDERSLTFVYHDCIRWLPHSLDSGASWFAFWTLLGLGSFFWALCDWLPGKSSAESRAGCHPAVPPTGRAEPKQREENSSPKMDRPGTNGLSLGSSPSSPLEERDGERRPFLSPTLCGHEFSALPARLRRLLWVLVINGALLGTEAIVQRAAYSPKLLFLVQPRIHQTADGQFGPYAYRSNAAQYFNLLWPVCLGFWWTLNRGKGAGPGLKSGRHEREGRPKHQVLLVAAAIMAASPIISTSRGGMIISVTMAGVCALLFAATEWLDRPHSRDQIQTRRLRYRALTAFLFGAMIFGSALGWSQLYPRLTQLNDGLASREQIYAAARPMAHDYPLFGTGPGSFETVSQLYPRPDVFWPAQLHNDWLETRITFGYIGSGLVALALICVPLRWWVGKGIHAGRRFVLLTWLALAGCLLHARFDFPFQIHSTLFLFVLLCGILFTLSRHSSRMSHFSH